MTQGKRKDKNKRGAVEGGGDPSGQRRRYVRLNILGKGGEGSTVGLQTELQT